MRLTMASGMSQLLLALVDPLGDIAAHQRRAPISPRSATIAANIGGVVIARPAILPAAIVAQPWRRFFCHMSVILGLTRPCCSPQHGQNSGRNPMAKRRISPANVYLEESDFERLVSGEPVIVRRNVGCCSVTVRIALDEISHMRMLACIDKASGYNPAADLPQAADDD